MRSSDPVASGGAGGELSRLRRSETGAGSVLALMVMASCVAFVSLLLPLVAVGVVHERAQALSDQAALAAANALSGAMPGIPCDAAGDVVAQMHTQTWSCILDHGDAFVVIEVSFGPVVISVRSRAGFAAIDLAQPASEN